MSGKCFSLTYGNTTGLHYSVNVKLLNRLKELSFSAQSCYARNSLLKSFVGAAMKDQTTTAFLKKHFRPTISVPNSQN